MTKPHGSRLRVALAFPNTYWVGMSNLGFQTVYRPVNAEDDVVCERFFLPPKQELAEQLATNTRRRHARVADAGGATSTSIAFSVSFEWDYVNVLTLLRLAGIPRYAAERTSRHPARCHRRRGNVREPGTAGACSPTRLPQAKARCSYRRFGARSAPRATAPICCAGCPVSAGSTSRRSTSRITPTGRLARRIPRVVGRADAGAQSGAQDHRDGRSTGDEHLHAGHGIRLAPARSRSSAVAQICAASAGPAITTCPCVHSRPNGSSSSPKRRGPSRAGSGSCRSRYATIRTSSASWPG